jgi:hypothetical protein
MRSQREPFLTECDRSLLSSGAWAPITLNATASDALAGLRSSSAAIESNLWTRVIQPSVTDASKPSSEPSDRD